MFNFLNPDAPGPTPREIAVSFRWLGWVGFALQAVLGVIPLIVVVTNALFSPIQRQIGFSFGLWSAIACLGLLIFSIYWSFRYTMLARRLEDPDRRPSKVQVVQDIKWGLMVNLGIIAISTTIGMFRVGQLTYKMLTLPQSATVITPNPLGTTVAAPSSLIAPSNMIAIQAVMNAIAAGLVGVVVSLLLLSLVGQHRNVKS